MSAIKQTELTAQVGAGGGTAAQWIGGRWLDSGEHRESFNPATGAVIGCYALGGREEAEVNALIAEVISETDGLPPGVVNVLTGGRDGLEYLVESPDVPVISFTGSTRTGRAISAAGAARLKRFGLELGGKAPMLIFDDGVVA